MKRYVLITCLILFTVCSYAQRAEFESIGYFDDILLGDRANVVNDVDVNGMQTRYNYVYFKSTGHLYHVEYYMPRFIKSVSNYRQFYFGILNHK